MVEPTPRIVRHDRHGDDGLGRDIAAVHNRRSVSDRIVTFKGDVNTLDMPRYCDCAARRGIPGTQ